MNLNGCPSFRNTSPWPATMNDRLVPAASACVRGSTKVRRVLHREPPRGGPRLEGRPGRRAGGCSRPRRQQRHHKRCHCWEHHAPAQDTPAAWYTSLALQSHNCRRSCRFFLGWQAPRSSVAPQQSAPLTAQATSLLAAAVLSYLLGSRGRGLESGPILIPKEALGQLPAGYCTLPEGLQACWYDCAARHTARAANRLRGVLLTCHKAAQRVCACSILLYTRLEPPPRGPGRRDLFPRWYTAGSACSAYS